MFVLSVAPPETELWRPDRRADAVRHQPRPARGGAGRDIPWQIGGRDLISGDQELISATVEFESDGASDVPVRVRSNIWAVANTIGTGRSRP